MLFGAHLNIQASTIDVCLPACSYCWWGWLAGWLAGRCGVNGATTEECVKSICRNTSCKSGECEEIYVWIFRLMPGTHNSFLNLWVVWEKIRIRIWIRIKIPIPQCLDNSISFLNKRRKTGGYPWCSFNLFLLLLIKRSSSGFDSVTLLKLYRGFLLA